MTKLTTRARKKLKDSEFAIPSERKYPIENKAHAKNAIARAVQQVNAGNLSPSTGAMVISKARKVLGPKAK